MTQRYAPATGRNRSFILDVLTRVLPAEGTVLEIASGTGEHAVFFAPQLLPRVWLPSDISAEHLASIDAWRAAFPSPNLRSPIHLDVSTTPWPVELEPPVPAITAIVNINMLHITPWTCCEALLRGAARVLPAQGVLVLYGPFMRDGQHTAPTNAAFDRDLRRRNPAWGVRDLDEVQALAATDQLMCDEVIEMPANNLMVVLRHQPD